MSRVDTSIEVLLRVKAIGEELIAKAKGDLDTLAKAQVASGAAGAKAAEGSALFAAAATRSSAVIGGLAAKVAGLGAAYLSIAGARRAITLSNEYERVQLRLLGIFQAQLKNQQAASAETERIRGIAGQLSKESPIFGSKDILGAAAEIISTAPRAANDIARILKVTIDFAAAKFDGELAPAAEAIAKSFAGSGVGLSRLLPEFRAVESSLGPGGFQRFLRQGGGVDILERSFSGAAGALSASGIGVELQAGREFNALLREIGDELKLLTVPALRASIPLVHAFTLAVAAAGHPQERGAEFLRSLSGAADLVGLGGFLRDNAAVIDLFGGIGKSAEEGAAAAGAAAAAGPKGNPNQLLGAATIDDVVSGLGALSQFQEKALALRRQFLALQTPSGDFPFEAPSGGPGAFVDNAQRDIDLLYNLSLARDKAADETQRLTTAQEQFTQSAQRASDLVQAGALSAPDARSAIEKAAARFREVIEAARAAREETGTTAADASAKLKELTGLPLPEKPRFLDEFDKAIAASEHTLEDLVRKTGGLSQELSRRFQQPFSDLLFAAGQGKAGIEDFARSFLETLGHIAADKAAQDILSALLRPANAKEGVSAGLLNGIFDAIGGVFGFADGGLIPGPTRGYDHKLIAVDGGEYVLSPRQTRALGLHAPGSGLPSRPGGIGYATGGFVDSFATVARGGGTQGHAPTTVLPVLLADRDAYARIIAGEPTALVDAVNANPALRRGLQLALGSRSA